MKKSVRILLIVLCLATLLSAFGMFSFAEGETKQGWQYDAVTDENGDVVLDEDDNPVVKERYYVDGVALTGGPHTIGIYQYMFADDGEYIGLYDGYKNVGTPGKMDTDEYKSAVAAKNPIEALTFDAGTKYGGGSNNINNVIPEGGSEFQNVAGSSRYFSSKFWTVLRKAECRFVPKDGSKSNLYWSYGHAPAEDFDNLNNSSAHSYTDRGGILSLYDKGYVFDFELRLDELPNSNISILQVSDRKTSSDTSETYTGLDSEELVSVTKEGFIYSPKRSNALIACLNKGEFVRISVAIDNKNNKFDVYINGILMLDDLVLYDNSAQSVAEFKIEEARMFQVSSSVSNPVTFAIDNFYLYGGTEPVCTETAELKNGVFVEGSFVRRYVNGAAIVGNSKIVGNYFGQDINESISFSSASGAGFIGYKAHVTKSGVTVSNSIIPENIFVAPAEVEMAGKEFIAWKVTSQGASKLFPVGKTMRAESNVTAEAIGISIATLEGASIKTKGNASELRFMAKVSKADYDALVGLGAKVEAHMMIVPTAALDKTYGYVTAEHLKNAAGDELIDVKAESWYHTNDNFYYFTGSVGSIEDILAEYSAVSYLKITFEDGSEKEIYADYNVNKHSRSVHFVADKAYNDRTTKKGVGSYSEKVVFSGKDTFSPYKTAERTVLKKVLDTVAVINTGAEGIKVGGDYYESPFDFDNDDGAVTLGGSFDMSSIVAVIVDGVRLPESDYDVDEDGIRFDVDDGLIYITPNVSDTIKEWDFVDLTRDSGVFLKRVALPGADGDVNITAPVDGVEFAGKWKATNTPDANGNQTGEALMLNNVKYMQNKKYEEKSAVYYDLSELSTLSFWVYVPSGFENATFLVMFNSENPSSDGVDYYSYTVVTQKTGWTRVSLSRTQFGISRSPLGWNKITSACLTATGWDQTNKDNTVLYFSDFEATDAAASVGVLSARDITLGGGAVFAQKGFASVVDGKHVIFNTNDTTTASYKEDGVWYLPLNGFAGAKDSEAYYYSKPGIIQFLWDEDEYVFKAGEKKYTVNGTPHELTSAIFKKDGAIYITDKDAMTVFGYTWKYEDQMGLLILSNTENIVDSKKDQDTIFNMINDLVFVRPTGDKVIQDMQDYSQFKHPYLMIDSERWAELEYFYQHEQTLRDYLAKIDASYGVGTKKFTSNVNSFSRTDGIRLLSISRDVMEKTINWTLLYKLEYKLGDHTEEERQMLLERIWAEVSAACEFYDEEKGENSWNPSHFLDTAELSYPMGLMYDWLYDEWTPAQRSKIAKAIFENALCQTSSLPDGKYNYNLGGSTNNWNGVCNGGIMAGALAIVNDPYIVDNGLQDKVIKVIGDSVKGVERGMWVYAPDGGYEEGPGYWGYGSTYVQVWVGCVQSACGTNYGIYDAPGYEKSCLFTTYLGNGKTTWGFHDGGSGNATPSIASFFSYMSRNGAYSAIKYTALAKGWTSGISMYDVIWFDPHVVDKSIDLQLDAHYSLDTIMTFRSSWDTSNNIFAGLHGGDNQASHGDLDIGNFVIDVNGTYMICDLGSDSYNMNGYFGQYRWSYYRKRTEGQNTLVMLNHGESWNGKTGVPQAYRYDAQGNILYYEDGKPQWYQGAKPDADYYGQASKAISKGLDFQSGNTKAYGIVDMTPAYTAVKEGTVMRRGLYMTNDRNTVIIQDEGQFKTNQDVWWFAHTQGVITVLPGEKSAYIERNGIVLYAEIVEDPNAPTNAKFKAMAAESLDEHYVGDMVESGIYTGEIEGSRASITKLCIEVDNVSTYNIAVAFTVIESPNVLPAAGSLYAWTPMDEWTVD